MSLKLRAWFRAVVQQATPPVPHLLGAGWGMGDYDAVTPVRYAKCGQSQWAARPLNG